MLQAVVASDYDLPIDLAKYTLPVHDIMPSFVLLIMGSSRKV